LDKLTGRNLKKKVLELLKSKDFDPSLSLTNQLSGLPVVNALLSLLMYNDELVRWRAITGIGAICSKLAEHDIESARIIMRRLMWSLNDESGGIGWGAPESMSEIMARSNRLASEYHLILVSYLDEKGNFLEFDALQKGLIWGVARLSMVSPDLMRPAVPHLQKYLSSSDPAIRGLSAFALGLLGGKDKKKFLQILVHDHEEFQTFFDDKLINFRVSDLANKAISLLN
jgi:hypothetical protein